MMRGWYERSLRAASVAAGPAVVAACLTAVWVGFFLLNAAAAAYTALLASTGVWALYNGGLIYVIIALLIGVEYPVRIAYRKRHGGAEAR